MKVKPTHEADPALRQFFYWEEIHSQNEKALSVSTNKLAQLRLLGQMAFEYPYDQPEADALPVEEQKAA